MIQETRTTPKQSSLPLAISHEGTTDRTGIQPALTKQPVLQPPLLQRLILLAQTDYTYSPGTHVNNLETKGTCQSGFALSFDFVYGLIP